MTSPAPFYPDNPPAATSLNLMRQKDTTRPPVVNPASVPTSGPSSLPRPEANATSSQSPHDELSFKYCNQGWTLPSQIVANSTPLNTTCPYHAPISQNRLSGSMPEGARPTSKVDNTFLSDMPPICLTRDYSIGTSASCGCTCVKSIPDDLAREIDSIIPDTNTTARDRAGNRN